MAVIKVEPPAELASIKSLLKEAALTRACYDLIFLYKHGHDLGDVHDNTKAVTTNLVKYNLKSSDFPGGLQTRMKAAMQLRAL